MYTKVFMKNYEDLFFGYLEVGYTISTRQVNNGLEISVSGLSDDYVIQQIFASIFDG